MLLKANYIKAKDLSNDHLYIVEYEFTDHDLEHIYPKGLDYVLDGACKHMHPEDIYVSNKIYNAILNSVSTQTGFVDEFKYTFRSGMTVKIQPFNWDMGRSQYRVRVLGNALNGLERAKMHVHSIIYGEHDKESDRFKWQSS